MINWSGAVLSRTVTLGGGAAGLSDAGGAAAQGADADRIERTPGGYQSVVETDAETALLRFGGNGYRTLRALARRHFRIRRREPRLDRRRTGDARLLGNARSTSTGTTPTSRCTLPASPTSYCREQRLPVVATNGYLTRDPVSSVPDAEVPSGTRGPRVPQPVQPRIDGRSSPSSAAAASSPRSSTRTGAW